MFKNLSNIFSSPSRVKVLKFFVLQPALFAPAEVVAGVIGISKQAAQTELRWLARAGFIASRIRKSGTQYFLNEKAELVEPLRTFLEATTLPNDKKIAHAFQGIWGLKLIVATGVLANEPRSSVDLLIVAKRHKDPGIAKAVKRLEALSALPIRYAVLEASQYADRLESYDRLLRDVFEFNHRIVLGKR